MLLARLKNHTGVIFGCVLSLAYFLFAGLVPALYIQHNYTNGRTFVGLYAHLFRYGQFFGWITILFLIYPVTYLVALPGLDRTKYRIILLSIFVGVSIFVTILDVRSENHAPHEIKREILESCARLNAHFMNASPSKEDKDYYQNTMKEVLANRANWSHARFLHYLTIFIQTFNFLFIMIVVVALTIHGASPNFSNPPEFKKAVAYCSFSILISYLWVLMRVAFNHQKLIYFPKISNPVTEYVVIGFFAVATLLVAVRLISWFRDSYSIVIGISTIFFGFISALGVTGRITLVDLFGKDVGTLPYLTIFGAIAGLSVFVVLAYIMKADRYLESPPTTSPPRVSIPKDSNV